MKLPWNCLFCIFASIDDLLLLKNLSDLFPLALGNDSLIFQRKLNCIQAFCTGEIHICSIFLASTKLVSVSEIILFTSGTSRLAVRTFHHHKVSHISRSYQTCYVGVNKLFGVLLLQYLFAYIGKYECYYHLSTCLLLWFSCLKCLVL